MKLTEQAAYLKGLANGMEFDATTKEGKLIAALMELTEALAAEVTDLRAELDGMKTRMDDLHDYVEELDDDLDAVEEFLGGDNDDEDEDEDDDDDDDECDGNCDGCDGCDDDEYYEIVCPSCGETICFDKELDPENLTCPACGEKFGCIVEEDDYKKISSEDKPSE